MGTGNLNVLVSVGARIQECTGAMDLSEFQTVICAGRMGDRRVAVWCDRSAWEGFPDGERAGLVAAAAEVCRTWLIERAGSRLARGLSVPDCTIIERKPETRG